MRARALLRAEPPIQGAEIRSSLARASELIDEMGARRTEPVVHELLAELARHEGDGAAAHRELREAHRLFTEIGGHAARLARELES